MVKKKSPRITFAGLVDSVIDEHRGNNPEKIIVESLVLLESAREEADKYSLSKDELRISIQRYLDDKFKERDLILVNAAFYACQVIANHCFVNQFDENVEIPIDVDWVVNKSSGNFFAIVKKRGK